MGSYASHQPKKVFPTVCERGTSPNLLECIDAHDLLRMSPVADPSISQGLGDLSRAFKGFSHTPLLACHCVVRPLSTTRAMPNRRSQFPIGRARPIFFPAALFSVFVWHPFGLPIHAKF